MENNYKIEEVSKKKKYTLLLASILLQYILPFIIVGFEFNIFQKDTSVGFKLTGVGLLLSVILAFKFSSKINEKLKSIKNIATQKSIIIVKNLSISILIIVILENMKSQIAMLEFLTVTLCLCFTIGAFLEKEYEQCLIKEEKYIKKQETIQAFKEYEESKQQNKK